MAHFPTPPASRHGSRSPDVDSKNSPLADSSAELLQSLDSLLERYLDLVDRHEKLHAELAKRLSSGFLSLAQANYACAPGRRYGADYYDERMKATRRILLERRSPKDSIPYAAGDPDKSIPLDNSRHSFAVHFTNGDGQTGDDESSALGGGDAPQVGQSRSEGEEKSDGKDSNTTKRKGPSESSGPHKSAESEVPKAARKISRSLDPITWYGILVPPALRSAQQSFTDAVEGQVPALVSVMDEMRTVESEINRLRRELGEE